jgi:hypothetical protein
MEQKRARMRRLLMTVLPRRETWPKFRSIFGPGRAQPQLAVAVARLTSFLAELVGRDS